MESPDIDIKPIIQTHDIPDRGSLTLPGICKLKLSRYEDVWPEDVHAAFMEAVALYPPMGKRRLKYYRVSTHADETKHLSETNRAKSFGRCQLIQSYILEKTGKNRSRKQVSSHLQRLKKIHKDNPAMRPLFSERSQPTSEHCSGAQAAATSGISSQDSFPTFSTRYHKNDFDLAINLQETSDTGIDDVPTIVHISESCDGGPCNTLDSSPIQSRPSIYPQECLSTQQYPATFCTDYVSELQDPLTTINGGFRAGPTFNASAFSISMRRLASRLPIQVRVDSSNPTTQFSRMVHAPAPPSTQQWVSQDVLADGICYNPSLTPTSQLFHTPFHSLQLFPPDKQRPDSEILAPGWMWSPNSDMTLGSREGTFSEYVPTLYQYSSTYPGLGMRESPACFYNYPYVPTSPVTVSESLSAESGIDLPGHVMGEPFEDLGSPLVIRPTPVYPVSYIHHSNDTYQPPPSLPTL